MAVGGFRILVVTVSVLVVMLAVVFPLCLRCARLHPGELFALTNSLPVHLNPPAAFFRHHHTKSDAYQQGSRLVDRSLVQWWNYAIVDTRSGMSWTIAYGLTNLRDEQGKDTNATVASVFFTQRQGPHNQAEATDFGLLNQSVLLENWADFLMYDHSAALSRSAGESPLHSQKISADGSTYTLSAKLHNEKQQAIAFDLIVHRVHGNYFGDPDDGRMAATCSSTSTFYGYHSVVEGVITSPTGVYQFETNSPHTRVYAGGTWGCFLPFGQPPVDYPWTWIWLVIPNAYKSNNTEAGRATRVTSSDIAITAGSVRYASYPASPTLLRLVRAESLIVDMDNEHFHLTSMKAMHGTSVETRILAAAASQIGQNSNGVENADYLINANISVSDWTTLTDSFGSSRLPLTQHYQFQSRTIRVYVRVRATIDEFFRIPMMRDQNIYSDFRANSAADVYARIERMEMKRGADGNEMAKVLETIYDGAVHTKFSAVEYAYADPYPPTPHAAEKMLRKARAAVAKSK